MFATIAMLFALAVDPGVSFHRDIRPILSDNCFRCHGPDGAARRAGVRLDTADGLAEVRGFILERVTAADPADRMPPLESGKALSAREVDLVRAWVEAGAPWERHWAFEPITSPAPPTVGDEAWPRETLDRFVLARLESAGIAPSREADRATWLRRVTFDLTGLPPSIAELEAFLSDDEPEAYPRVVERLLASSAYGERMATPWLDAARYADSYGFQSDQLSPTWPYRDWVVRAFNENVPYDDFLTKQIAGDLLPGATRDDRLATAFNRLHRMTNEGGSIAEEFRLEAVSDRVHTLGTAVLGLTLECARCHDHKFDPIRQREYYALSAFFNSIDEYGLYENAGIVPTPSLLLPTEEQERELARRQAALRGARAALVPIADGLEDRFSRWTPPPDLGIPDLVGRFDFETPETSGHLGPGIARVDDGEDGTAVRLDGDDAVHFDALQDIDRWTPFSIAFRMRDDEPEAAPRVVAHRSSGTDVGYHGVDLMLVDGHLRARIVRHWPGNALAIETVNEVIPPRTWTHVAWTYDGSSTADGLALYVNGRPVGTRSLRDRIFKSVGAGYNHGPGGQGVVFGQRFRDRGLRGALIDDVVLVRRALVDFEVEQLVRPAPFTEGQRFVLHNVGFDAAMRQGLEAVTDARQAVVQLEDQMLEVPVMQEMTVQRATYVLDRGRYDAPRTHDGPVPRATPAVLSPWPDGAPSDRLGLARWLTDPAHPLTARVAVNRIWQQFFGPGLVETSEDFGAQGRPPTHPDLLDWLAFDFRHHGWDVKRLCRMIALSATYRQASARSRPPGDDDPENELLARGPARRLSAEEMRDAALAVSGLLDRAMGGPPVSPYQPPGLWRESNTMSPAYHQSVGTALHRRSLYSVWKRTAPLPNMIAFDAPTREVCRVRRSSTSTPLQALVLLNDPQFVEAARALAARMLAESDDDTERVHFAFRVLTCRAPRDAETAILADLLDEQRRDFAAQPESAAALLAIGSWPQPESDDPIEAAAATVVAQAILNLDATGWKR